MTTVLAQSPPPNPPAPETTEAATQAAPAIEGWQGFLSYVLTKLREAFLKMGDDFIGMLPNLVIALVLLFVGLVIAKVIRGVLTATFKRIKLDALFEKIGLSEIFNKIGLKAGPSDIIPKIIYWLILLNVVSTAAEAAGIKDISNLLDQIMAFLPKVLTSSIILLIGFVIADLIQNAAFRALDRIGLEYAGSLSRILFGFIFVLILTVALAQLGIETELLNASVKIVLAGLALAMALSLGLGLKTLAGQIVAGVYARDLFKVGTELEFDDAPAKVSGVGPVTTKLVRDDGSFLTIPNTILVGKIMRGRTKN